MFVSLSLPVLPAAIHLPLSCSQPSFIAPFLQLPFVFFALAALCCSPPLCLSHCVGVNAVISSYQGFGNGRRHWEGHWVNLLRMTFKYPSLCSRHQMCYCWLREVAAGHRFLSGQLWLLSDVPHAAALKQMFGSKCSGLKAGTAFIFHVAAFVSFCINLPFFLPVDIVTMQQKVTEMSECRGPSGSAGVQGPAETTLMSPPGGGPTAALFLSLTALSQVIRRPAPRHIVQ